MKSARGTKYESLNYLAPPKSKRSLENKPEERLPSYFQETIIHFLRPFLPLFSSPSWIHEIYLDRREREREREKERDSLVGSSRKGVEMFLCIEKFSRRDTLALEKAQHRENLGCYESLTLPFFRIRIDLCDLSPGTFKLLKKKERKIGIEERTTSRILFSSICNSSVEGSD